MDFNQKHMMAVITRRRTLWALNNVAVLTIGGNDYRIPFWFMTKSDVVDKMKNADLREKTGQYGYKKS